MGEIIKEVGGKEIVCEIRKKFPPINQVEKTDEIKCNCTSL
jgi:hypothetical protein